MNRLHSKVAIITGGARGMGAVHGRIFAQGGAKVLLGDVLDEDGQQAAAVLRDAGYVVEYVRLDVASAMDWEKAVEFATERWGKLDVLVNNAGIAGNRTDLENETNGGWQLTTDINQKGVWLGMKYCVPAMRQAGGGSIVNISSMNGVVGMPAYFSYQASKGAVRMMSKSAALSYAKDKIRVNTVCPGLIYTPMGKADGEEANADFVAATPLSRGGEAEEVSWGVLFLASDEASYITATELIIDGGYSAQ